MPAPSETALFYVWCFLWLVLVRKLPGSMPKVETQIRHYTEKIVYNDLVIAAAIFTGLGAISGLVLHLQEPLSFTRISTPVDDTLLNGRISYNDDLPTIFLASRAKTLGLRQPQYFLLPQDADIFYDVQISGRLRRIPLGTQSIMECHNIPQISEQSREMEYRHFLTLPNNRKLDAILGYQRGWRTCSQKAILTAGYETQYIKSVMLSVKDLDTAVHNIIKQHEYKNQLLYGFTVMCAVGALGCIILN
jgi:hypothetical protein